MPLDPSVRIAVAGDLAGTENLGDRGSSLVTSSEVITPFQGIQNAIADARFFGSEEDFDSLADYDVTVLVVGLTYVEEGEYIPTQQQEAEGSDLARGGDRATLALPDAPTRPHRQGAPPRETSSWSSSKAAAPSRSRIGWTPPMRSIMAWYPGCRGGEALARVLLGDACPSGKLPVTFAASMNQLPPWTSSR
ncbi:MAG: glycoside hydrolase family 3 C-terminal domain-containing protein [Gammaproteobacteria bacterium]|nr:glycoside hydrolase family 3 C-terminal domain-containing protein [Gammaproteobacteria bacterium]